jgi:DNA-binding CsgD family transcriptional regulator
MVAIASGVECVQLDDQLPVAEQSVIDRVVLRSIEQLLDSLPIAAVLIDWDLRVVCWNPPAAELCTRWKASGPVSTLAAMGDNTPALPADVLAYCRFFKIGWRLRYGVRGVDLRHVESGGICLPHSTVAGLYASVRVVHFEVMQPCSPMFLIRLEDRREKMTPPSSSLMALARLSACERQVALLVSDGCSNEEVAQRLDKSVLTVKKQLRSIYQKLHVRSRGRLSALMH